MNFVPDFELLARVGYGYGHDAPAIKMFKTQDACPQALCRSLAGDTDTLLSREWLITNGRGGFASGTVIGCPTRRYHSLLTAAYRPPLQRYVILTGTDDVVTINDRPYNLSTLELSNGLAGHGYELLKEFDLQVRPPNPWAYWRYRTNECDIHKRVTLLTDTDIVLIRYEITCIDDYDIKLEVAPLLALRDFHELRPSPDANWNTHNGKAGLWIEDNQAPDVTLGLIPLTGAGRTEMSFESEAPSAEGLHLRTEAAVGYANWDCVQRRGRFVANGKQKLIAEIAACAYRPTIEDAAKTIQNELKSKQPYPSMVRANHNDRTQRLRDAADQFIVRRVSKTHHDLATIIAGYHWFGDWGRDTFISLEGLLLCNRRFTQAREVLATFAGAQKNGLIPNLFDDYGGECHYNSADASLWFIHAADRYLTLSGDKKAWTDFLASACANIVEAYTKGTDYNIGIDASGLVVCGHEHVQITWMDAKCENTVFTPRHGRPVEINALWYNALRLLSERFTGKYNNLAAKCRSMADTVAESFNRAFWRDDGTGLHDCVRDDFVDSAIRPNQILAVSLAHSPLSHDRMRAVLNTVSDKLLTPYGLRSLAPEDPAYHGIYCGNRYERDAAYHQGTVWSWLIGPYVEAYLRVNGINAETRAHAQSLIDPLLAHVDQAGIGTISEIFDGDAPHAPRGCIAQAWSVAELIRVLTMIDMIE